MKVLVVTRDFPPHSNGGISTAVGHEVDGLVAAGHVCGVVSFDAWRPRKGPKPGMKTGTTRVKTDATAPVAAGLHGCGGVIAGTAGTVEGQPVSVQRIESPDDIAAAVEFTGAFGPDIVHLHHGMLFEFADGVRRRFDVPMVKTVHILQHVMNRMRGLDRTESLEFQRRAITASDAIIVMSRYAADQILTEYPDVAERIHVIPPGIPDRPTAAAATWPRDPVTAVSAGRFSDVKGTETLFGIADELARRIPGIEVVIAGGLPDSPASERRVLRRRAAALNGETNQALLTAPVSESGSQGKAPAPQSDLNTETGRPAAAQDGDVTFAPAVPAPSDRARLAGWLSRSELDVLFARSSVYMCASATETFGLSVAEAMLHGVPAVSFECGGTSEIIEDGVTGIIVPQGDVASFVESAAALLSDPGLCARMGNAARAAVVNRFSPTESTTRLSDLFRHLSRNKGADRFTGSRESAG